MQTRTARLLMTAALSSLLLAGPAMADEGHDHGETSDAAKYRHIVMEAIGNHFAAIALVVTGRVQAGDDLATHANALAETSTLTAGLFGEGSQGGGALPIAWKEPEKVAEAANKAAEANAALAAAINNGADRPALMKAFKAAGDGCKACHERYKEEDD